MEHQPSHDNELLAVVSKAGVAKAGALIPDGLLKSVHTGPATAVGALTVVVVAAGVPAPVGVTLLLALIVLTVLLWAGAGEPVAVRVFFRARRLSSSGPLSLDRLMEDLGAFGLGPAAVDIYLGSPARGGGAVGFGRRSVVVGPSFIADVSAGRIPWAEAVAILAREGFSVRSGMTRNDAAIMLWSSPWRAAALAARPLAGIIGFAWKVRVLVFSIAIYQSATGAGASEGYAPGAVTAVGLALLLLSTFAVPRAGTTWVRRVRLAADEELARHGQREVR